MAKRTDYIRICPECGADSPSTKERCWICRGDLAAAPELVVAENINANSQPNWVAGSDTPLNLAVLGCLLVTLIGIGIGLQNHWLLIPYMIIAGPALLITLIHTEAKVLDKRKVKPEQIVATFFLSTVAIVAILALLGLALFISFWVLCYALGGPNIQVPAPR